MRQERKRKEARMSKGNSHGFPSYADKNALARMVLNNAHIKAIEQGQKTEMEDTYKAKRTNQISDEFDLGSWAI